MSKVLLREVVRSLVKENVELEAELGTLFREAVDGDSESWKVFLDRLEELDPQKREQLTDKGCFHVLMALDNVLPNLISYDNDFANGFSLYVRQMVENYDYTMFQLPNSRGIQSIGIPTVDVARIIQRNFLVKYANTIVHIMPGETHLRPNVSIYYANPVVNFRDEDLREPARASRIHSSVNKNRIAWVYTIHNDAYEIKESLDLYDEDDTPERWWTPELVQSVKAELEKWGTKAKADEASLEDALEMPRRTNFGDE